MGAAPGWSADSKLSGKACVGWSLLFDKDGKRFASGVPQLAALVQGIKVYDPRLDSTFPGGSGACRLGNEATYVYSDNPALHAGTYAFGRYQNAKLVGGVGLPVEAIDWANIAAWANTCQANGWTLFGAVYEPGDRWANLKDIALAGGAVPLVSGGVLSFHYAAPRVTLDTVTDADLADGDLTVTATASWRERINAVVPKYRSPVHNWEMVDAEKVTVAGYVAEDGEEKAEVFAYNLVKNKDQAAQLAAYRLVDGRELQPIEITYGPRLFAYGPGDCLQLNHPELGLDGPFVVLTRRFDPSTMTVTFTFTGETPAKHAFALGRTGVAPPTPALSQTATQRDELAFVISPVPADPGATAGATIGTDVRLPTRVPTRAELMTAEGIAAGFFGAGALAYQNNVALDQIPPQMRRPGQNALFNGGFTAGWEGWASGGLNLIKDWRGNIVEAPYGTGGVFVAESQRAINIGNGAPLTLSAVFTGYASVNGFYFCDIRWSNGGNGAHLGYSSESGNGCIIYNETVAKKLAWQAMTAPHATDGSGFVRGWVRIVSICDVAYPAGTRWVEQIKVESGSAPTPFSDEATNVATSIVGQGAGATANNLADLDPNAAAQLATAVNGGAVTVGPGETVKRKLAPGATIAATGQVALNAGGSYGSVICLLQASLAGSGSWTTFANGQPESVGPGEPGTSYASGPYTNTTGAEQLFEFRVDAARSPGGAGGGVITSQTFITC